VNLVLKSVHMPSKSEIIILAKGPRPQVLEIYITCSELIGSALSYGLKQSSEGAGAFFYYIKIKVIGHWGISSGMHTALEASIVLLITLGSATSLLAHSLNPLRHFAVLSMLNRVLLKL
jgi:hypothetical protein